MKRLLYLIITSLAILTGCDVHEWPVEVESVPFYINLSFQTEMGEDEFLYDSSESRSSLSAPHDIRYVIQAFPVGSDGRVSTDYVKQFVYSKAVIGLGEDYGFRTSLELPEGKYRLMVWADFVDEGKTEHKYYDCTNFNSIVLHGTHKANTDYRDAFSGAQDIELISTIQENVEIQETVVEMKRPLAKYTFISTDVEEFIVRELSRLSRNDGSSPDDTDSRVINLNDYKVVIYYPMYMPNTYNMFSDKAVNSATGVQFESKLVRLNEKEVSMGFDYVVINDDPDAKVTVRIGLFDKEGTQLTMSASLNVPLKRSVNMLVRGKFMTIESDGGISIDPGFNGDHNIVLP